MLKTITAEPEMRTATRLLRTRIKQIAGNRAVRNWVFPDGSSGNYPTFVLETRRGPLFVALPKPWERRIPHLFRLGRDVPALSPDVQLNVPYTLDRSISGLYVRQGRSVWLCSRGHFTAYRGKIPGALSLEHFQKWLVEISDGDRLGLVIPVIALHSNNIADELAEFVSSVLELRTAYRAGELEGRHSASRWGLGKEPEGKRLRTITTGTTEYEYLHGPLCNSLIDELRAALAARDDYRVDRNQQVDCAILRRGTSKAAAIFEVKTSADYSQQLFSAVGQLLYYRHRYGQSDASLFLVLPAEVVPDRSRFAGADFFRDLGVHVVVRSGSSYATLDGTPLTALIQAITSTTHPVRRHAA